jgi:hypothetical protein
MDLLEATGEIFGSVSVGDLGASAHGGLRPPGNPTSEKVAKKG